MPIIDVEGIGELEFPDDMSEQEIEAAIKTHPSYEEVTKNPEHHLWTKAKLASQGIPIAGHLIKDSPQMKNYKVNYPIRSQLLHTGGSIGSMLPLSGGMAVAMGTKLIPSLFGQGALSGALGYADKEMEDAVQGTKTPFDEKFRNAGFQTLAGMAGPGAAKVLSPGMTKAGINELAKWGAAVGIGGAHMGIPPLLGALAGAGYRSLASNRMLNNPAAHGILAALTGGTAKDIDPEVPALMGSFMSGAGPLMYAK